MAVLIAVPGPSVLFVVSRGVALGRRAAVSTAVGNELGLLVQVAAVVLGLGELLERSQLAFTLVKCAGALYLVYLGVRTWQSRGSLIPEDGADARPAAARTGRILREGFVVGVSNPKGVLIFGAVLPQFVDTAAGNVRMQLLLLGLLCVLVALLSDTVWGVLAGTARGWLAGSPRRLSALGGASGLTMIGLGAHLAVSDRD